MEAYFFIHLWKNKYSNQHSTVLFKFSQHQFVSKYRVVIYFVFRWLRSFFSTIGRIWEGNLNAYLESEKVLVLMFDHLPLLQHTPLPRPPLENLWPYWSASSHRFSNRTAVPNLFLFAYPQTETKKICLPPSEN